MFDPGRRGRLYSYQQDGEGIGSAYDEAYRSLWTKRNSMFRSRGEYTFMAGRLYGLTPDLTWARLVSPTSGNSIDTAWRGYPSGDLQVCAGNYRLLAQARFAPAKAEFEKV